MAEPRNAETSEFQKFIDSIPFGLAVDMPPIKIARISWKAGAASRQGEVDRLREFVAEFAGDCASPLVTVDGVVIGTNEEGEYVWPDGVRIKDDRRNWDDLECITPCDGLSEECWGCWANKLLGRPLTVYDYEAAREHRSAKP